MPERAQSLNQCNNFSNITSYLTWIFLSQHDGSRCCCFFYNCEITKATSSVQRKCKHSTSARNWCSSLRNHLHVIRCKVFVMLPSAEMNNLPQSWIKMRSRIQMSLYIKRSSTCYVELWIRAVVWQQNHWICKSTMQLIDQKAYSAIIVASAQRRPLDYCWCETR